MSTTQHAAAEANDKGPAVHRVYSGHTLGKLAKRYHVSVDAICNANDIRRSEPLNVGDELVIPARDDNDGSQAKKERERLLGKQSRPVKKEAPEPEAKQKAKPKPKAADPKIHVVYRGQTLGMIARRYHVSVDAISNANKLSSSDIHPGDELIIPSPGDEDGSRARAARAKLLDNEPATSVKPSSADTPKIHIVGKGHTLGKIASRYHVSVDALCHANDIRPTTPLKINQELVVPAKGDADGSQARAWQRRQQTSDSHDSPKGHDWRDYQKAAWRRGYITLESPNGDRSWTGYVIGPGDKLLPLARKKVTAVLASWRTGKTKTIDARLVKLIAQVSDTFGGRPLRVVSGYREHSHSKSSRHKLGRALDFSVQGVPNWAVRDYLRSLPDVGVGYYPNSSFVHLDVREGTMYWVDVSGPGETPRYVHKSRGPAE